MRIVFSGSIGRLPVGGHAWAQMNYLAGLAALGHDVYYLEECGEGSWVYDWDAQELTTDLDYPAAYVRAALQTIGLDRRWIYRAGDDARGIDPVDFADVCADADLLIVRAVPLLAWRPEYDRASACVFIDADPGFTQIKAATGDQTLLATIDRADRLFTIGHHIGDPGCPIPSLGRRWEKTVPPVFLPSWPASSPPWDGPMSCVVQWKGYGELEYNGHTYGDKDRQFPPYLDLPRLTGRRFEIALTGAPLTPFREHGWEALAGWEASATPQTYQDFIRRSRAEVSIAKHGYVEARCGWFSDRSACYLACGRPVIVQDTGLDWLAGEGVVTFSSPSEAIAAVQRLETDYQRHAIAARRLAEATFASEHVISKLLGGL